MEHSKSGSILSAITEDPIPLPRIRIISVGTQNLPVHCYHCEEALCMEACLAGALFRDRDGAVLVDSNECTGCMACATACPFGIPEFDVLRGVMVKCDLCPDRRAEGKLPACVEACKTGALQFGSIEELLTSTGWSRARDGVGDERA
ncbi:4Fe-4S ferredoxin [Thermococcus sp. 21S9]|nr:4Fe-4S ferredoxin [Thermococcus sp. 21S9]